MPREPREKKVLIVENLKELFSKSSVGVLTDYRGLTAAEMTALRRRLRESGIDYRVVKNTLARLAASRAGKEEVISSLEGPIAIAFGYGDIKAPGRVLDEYIRSSKTSLSIKGGFLGSRLLTSEEVIVLYKLPSREVLLGKVLGGMQAPILALLASLTAPMRGMIGVLQSRIQQLEGK